MSIKSKVLATAATLTLVGGVGMAGALGAGTAASAATPSCGSTCIDIFSYEFGQHHAPNYVVDVLRQGEKVGQPIILFRTANFDPAEDWSIAYEGQVSDFFAADLVGDDVDLHYGGGCAFAYPVTGDSTSVVTPGTLNCLFTYPDDPAFEIEYAPYGVESGLCMGVSSTAVQEEGVTLQPCGVSSKTVWIVDTYDPPYNDEDWYGSYLPAINGSDTNFSQPFVLTYPQSGYPTDMPRVQLQVDQLTGFEACTPHYYDEETYCTYGPEEGTINDNQLWGADFGVLTEHQ
jgi:hypothetical protein